MTAEAISSSLSLDPIIVERRERVFIVLAGVLLSFWGCKKSDFTEVNIEENDFIIAQIDSSTNVMASELYKRLVNSELLNDGGYLDSSTYFDTLNSIVIDSISSLEAWNVRVEDEYVQYRRYKNDYQRLYVDYLFNKIIIEYDGFKEHFDDIEEVNVSNYEFYLKDKDIYRQKTLEGYGYKFLRINKFNLGKDPIEVLNRRIRDLVKKK